MLEVKLQDESRVPRSSTRAIRITMRFINLFTVLLVLNDGSKVAWRLHLHFALFVDGCYV